MEPSNSFGEWLRRRRRTLDWTQEELAKRVGCAVGTIRKIEADELRPSKQLAEILAQRLDIPSKEREDFVRFARGVLRDSSLPLPFIEDTASLLPSHRNASPTHNLPIQLTSFIGREREMADVKHLLLQSRLVTLTGTGGCGKTRLALQVAADLADAKQFANGVWLIELAPLADPALVPQTVAAVFGLREEEARTMLEVLSDYLREKNLLLILDNCEHLIDACAKFADTLLHTCHQLKILASSREASGVAGEVPYRVPSLSLPSQDSNIETLPQSEAVRLLIDRAVTLEPSFALTNQNAPAIAQICRRLDGIPLALELAAARIKVLSIEQISKKLDDRFKLLTGGSRTALPRQQTLRALIDWSYGLLSEAERILLRRLAVFAGGWTLEAAQAVCGCDPVCADDVLDLIAHLVDKSLVMVEQQGDAARYRMMETIRQYARDKLLESGEGEQIRTRHLDFFLRVAEEAEPKLRGPEQHDWLARLDIEHDNLRSALEWSTSEGCVERGMRLVCALLWFWVYHSYWSEGLGIARNLSRQPEESAGTLWRANTLYTASLTLPNAPDQAKLKQQYLEEAIRFAREQGDAGRRTLALGLGLAGSTIFDDDLGTAQSRVEEALAIARSLGDSWLVALSLYHLGAFFIMKRDVESGYPHLEESLQLFQFLGDKRQAAKVSDTLAHEDTRQLNLAQARLRYQEFLPLLREEKDKRGIQSALNVLGVIARVEEDYDSAKNYLTESLACARDAGSGIFAPAWNLAAVLLTQGEIENAKPLFVECMNIMRHSSNKVQVGYAIHGYADLAAVQKQPRKAIVLFAAVRKLNEEAAHKGYISPAGEADFARNLAIAREQVDETTFNAAWAEGRALTMEQAIEYALAQ